MCCRSNINLCTFCSLMILKFVCAEYNSEKIRPCSFKKLIKIYNKKVIWGCSEGFGQVLLEGGGEINVQYDAISICTNWQHLSIRDRIRSHLKLQFSCLNIILIAKTYLILYKMTFRSNYTLYLSRYCLLLAFYIFRRDLSLDVLDFKEQCKAHQ